MAKAPGGPAQVGLSLPANARVNYTAHFLAASAAPADAAEIS